LIGRQVCRDPACLLIRKKEEKKKKVFDDRRVQSIINQSIGPPIGIRSVKRRRKGKEKGRENFSARHAI